jgi:hypothetical protein
MRASAFRKALFSGAGAYPSAAAFLGAFFAACALSFSFASGSILDLALSPGTREGSDYLVVGRALSALEPTAVDANAFDEGDIAALRALPGVRDVVPVVSNACRAEAIARLGFATYRSEMFFESVPDAFLGELPEAWRDDDPVPVIVSRDFVALYNVGFAPSRGLPALDAGALGELPLSLRFSGPGGSMELEARVVGTTDRFSSFLLPERVMRRLNEGIAREPGKVRRLAVVADNARDPGLARSIAALGCEVTSGNAVLSEAAAVAKAALGFSAIAGAVAALLSIAVTAAATQALTARRRDSIELLSDLGWERGAIRAAFTVRSLSIGCPATLLGVAAASVAAVIAGAAIAPSIELSIAAFGIPFFAVPVLIPLGIAAAAALSVPIPARRPGPGAASVERRSMP